MNVLQRQEEFHRKCLEEDRQWRERQADKENRYRIVQLILMVVVGFGAVWLGATLNQRFHDAAARSTATETQTAKP